MVIRKPKFMRNMSAVKAYMTLAENFAMLADKSDTTDEIYEHMKKSGEYINEAAKAAGFLKTEDFIKWLDNEKAKLET